jgi:colanic acid biosynthesis glycosyl transferase WcaI
LANILLLSLVYEPDRVSTATMIADIARGLQAAGHDVTVMTTIPHYNPPPEEKDKPAYAVSLRRLYTELQEDGVRVFRVFMPLKKERVWSRLLHYLWFQAWATLLALWKGGSYEVVFVTSPPITLGLTGVLLARLRRAAFIYDVRELWPDVPVQMGLIRNRLLLRAIYGLERFVYRRAAAISSVARAFNERLHGRGVPLSKLYFTPNFVDVDWVRPGCKRNVFSLQRGLADRFVILYAGNIGLTQGLEILVDVGRAFRDAPAFQILIIGDGAGRPALAKALSVSGLNNIRLLPLQPAEQVPEIYATADVSVVLVRAGFSYYTVPSKLYTSMAAGRAVVLLAEEDTEAATLLREAEAGICVPPESPADLVKAIRVLRAEPELRERLGANGRKWAVERYSREAVLPTYDRIVREVVSGMRRVHR